MARGRIVERVGVTAAVVAAAVVLGMTVWVVVPSGAALAAGPADPIGERRAAVVSPATASGAGAGALASSAAMMEPGMRRAAFTWTGGGGDNNWSTVQNWSVSGCLNVPCYPRTSNDDAAFADVGFSVHLDGNYTIDDLTLDTVGGSYIDGESESNRKLTCDSVVVSGDTGGEGGGVHVKNLACVETN